MPDLFTNIRSRSQRYVDRNNDGQRSRGEWLGAGARTAFLGPVGAGASILIPALADTIRETDIGNRVGNWFERQARRAGWGEDSFVGPPEESRRERRSRNNSSVDPIFRDSGEESSSGETSDSSTRSSERRSRGPSGWVPGATAVQIYGGSGPQSSHDRTHLVSGGYGTGGLLGLSNRQVMRQSEPVVRRALIQPR